MKIIKHTFVLFLLTLFFSCKDEKENKAIKNTKQITQNIMGININDIKKHIELQKKVDTEEEEFDNAYDLNLKDLELVSSIMSEELKKKGFKNISDIEYEEKINLIFNINIQNKCEKYIITNDFITLFGVRMDGDLKTLLDNQYDLYSSTENIFIFKKEHFLFNMFMLKDIIKINQDNSFELKVPQYIIARNKYIFNDSKADFVWLRFNDPEFLETLVKKYGYVNDKELSKFVLDKSLEDTESFVQVISTKDCSGKFIFHKEIIEIIKTAPQESQKKYLETIYLFFEYLRDNPENNLDLTFSEKSEISGKLAYYASKIAERISNNSYSSYSFFPFLDSEEYQKEFEKKNYYNIKDFKEVYDDSKTGGVSYPGQE